MVFTSIGPASIDSFDSNSECSGVSGPIFNDSRNPSPFELGQSSDPKAIALSEASSTLAKVTLSTSSFTNEGPQAPVVEVIRSFEDIKSFADSMRSPSSSSAPILIVDNKLDQEYNDVEGDLYLISNDGIVFKLTSNLLRCSSAPFAAMFPLASPPIKVTIKFDQKACVIRFFLNFLHGNIPRPEFQLLGTFRRAVGVAKTFDCKLVLTAMRYFARQYMYQEEYLPRYVFIIACNLGDINLCADTIRDGDDGIYCSTGEYPDPADWYDVGKVYDNHLDDEDPSLEGDDLMDPTTWSAADINQIPLKYFAVYLRAFRIIRSNGEHWFDIATKFEKLMERTPVSQQGYEQKKEEKIQKVKKEHVDTKDLPPTKKVNTPRNPLGTPDNVGVKADKKVKETKRAKAPKGSQESLVK